MWDFLGGFDTFIDVKHVFKGVMMSVFVAGGLLFLEYKVKRTCNSVCETQEAS